MAATPEHERCMLAGDSTLARSRRPRLQGRSRGLRTSCRFDAGQPIRQRYQSGSPLVGCNRLCAMPCFNQRACSSTSGAPEAQQSSSSSILKGLKPMALLLDTEKIVPVARRDAVHDAYLRADVPRQVSLTSQQAIDSTRIEAWMLGSTKLFCVECPGMKVVRAAPSGRLDPMIALCIQGRGTGLSIEDGRQQQLMTGDLLMVGPTSPNEFLINGATSALELPFDEVGVSVETARKASERLPASPLYPLVARYLVSLRHDVDSISSSAAA